MANGNVKVALVVEGKDEGAKRLLNETADSLRKQQKSLAQANKQKHAYALTGIRSERSIQREILLTQQAYQRLARSGKASQNDLARAAVATKNKIRELHNELNQGIEKQSKWGKSLQTMANIGAAGAAAYAVAQPKIERYKQLDSRLREVTFNAFGQEKGNDVEWLEKQGMPQIHAIASNMVKANGGTADLAFDTIAGMLATGMNVEQVQQHGVDTHRLAIASAENGQADGAAAAKLMKVFADANLNPKEAARMAALSGMQGTFEMADMVKHLPALLPDAQAAGLTGESGLAFLLASLQSAANKSSSPDEAANNMKNFLQKVFSPDTQKRIDQSLKASGEKQNYKQMLLNGQAQGKNTAQIVGDYVQTALSNDPLYRQTKEKADKGDETAKQQLATLVAMGMGSVMTDMQARAGMKAVLDSNQMQQYMNGLLGQKTDVISGKTELMGRSAASRQEQATAQADLEMLKSQTMESLTEAETQFKELAATFPVATLALQTLAAAASAAALAQGVGGLFGGKGLNILGGLKNGTANLPKMAQGTGASAGLGKMAGAVGGALVVGNGLVNAYQISQNKQLTDKQKTQAQVENAASTGGALAGGALGAKLGAAIGTAIVPVVGTAIGGILGGLAGSLAGSWGASKAANALTADSASTTLPPTIEQQTAQLQTALQTQTEQYQLAIQNDTAVIGERLNAINSTLQGASQTVQTHIAVNLDGRVIANEVASQQVNIFKRGAGR